MEENVHLSVPKKTWRLFFFIFLLLTPLLFCDSGMAIPVSEERNDSPPIDQDDLKNNLTDYIDRAEKKLAQGDLGEMGSLARRLTEIDPDNDRLKALYSIYLLSKGENKAARSEFLKIKVPNQFSRYAEVMMLRDAGKSSQAMEACQKAIDMDQSHPFPYNLKGGIHMDRLEYTEAAAAFKKAIQLSPDFYPAYANLGFAFLKLKDISSAEGYFRRALQFNMDTASPHYGMALIHEQRGSISLAIEEAMKSLKAKALNNPAMEKLAELYLDAGKFEEALKIADEMKKNLNKGAGAMKARIYLGMGDGEKLMECVESMDGDPSSRVYLRGWGFLLQGNYMDALHEFNALQQDSKKDFGLYTALCVTKHYLNKTNDISLPLQRGWGEHQDRLISFISGAIDVTDKKDWNGAMKEWRQADGLFPYFALDGLSQETIESSTTPDELRNITMGLLFFGNHAYTKSIEKFEYSLSKKPSRLWSNYFVAQVYLKTGELEKAISHLIKAIDMGDNFYAALSQLVELEGKRGNIDAAEKYLSRAMAVKKNPIQILNLGALYEKMGRHEKAESYYRILIKDFPNLFLGYNHLAYLFAKTDKNLDEALELAQKADKLQPHNPLILDTMGWIFYQRKEFDKARESLDKALRITDRIPVILYHMALVYHQKKAYVEAITYLEKALDLTDQFEEAQEARKLLDELKGRSPKP